MNEINRRGFIGSGLATAAAVAVGTPLVLMPKACSGDTSRLSRWTQIAIDTLNQLSPILTNMGATGVVGILARVIPIAQRLKKAFDDNNNADALTLFDNLTNAETGLIVELSDAIGVLQGPQRVILLGIMAAASIFFRLIAANIAEEVPQEAVTRARAAKPKAVSSIERAAKGGALEAAFAAVKF